MNGEQLIKVIKSRDVARLEPFLAGGFDLNAPLPTRDKETPLQLAIKSSANEIAVALIKSGVSLADETAFILWAVGTGDAEVVRRFIEAGADVNFKMRVFGPPLEDAARGGYLEIMRLLIDAGADIDFDSPLSMAIQKDQVDAAVLLIEAGARIAPSQCFLVSAVKNRQTKLLRALLKAGVDPNERADTLRYSNNTGQQEQVHHYATGLVVASAAGEDQIVKDLLQAGADSHLVDGDGMTALDWAQRNGHDAVAKLLEKAMADRPRTTGNTQADLLVAAQKGDAAAIRRLVDACIDVNARCDEGTHLGWTPLMLAADAAHLEPVEVLLEAGADPNACDDRPDSAAGELGFGFHMQLAGRAPVEQLRRTALHRAAEAGNAEIVDRLLAAGAEVNAIDKQRDTPLLLAAGAGSLRIVRALLAAGADVNLRNTDRQSPLARACAKEHADVVSELIAAGAKLDLKDNTGRTALLYAALRANPQIVGELLRAGAQVNVSDHYRNTPLHGPVDDRHRTADFNEDPPVSRLVTDPARILETVKRLLAAGADPQAKAQYGGTPLDMAKEAVKQTGALRDVVALLKKARPSGDQAKPKSVKKKASPPKRAKPAAKATPKKKPKKKSPKLKKPNFVKAAKTKAYEAALAELEELCGTKRHPLELAKGGFRIHIHSRKKFDLKKVHRAFLKKGFYVFGTEGLFEGQVAILPTTNRDEVIYTMHTNGANHGLTTDDIAAWLRELEKTRPFELTSIGPDHLSGEFTRAVKAPVQLAKKMYEFCPDIVDQGCGTEKALVRELRKSKRLFLWWD